MGFKNHGGGEIATAKEKKAKNSYFRKQRLTEQNLGFLGIQSKFGFDSRDVGNQQTTFLFKSLKIRIVLRKQNDQSSK